MHGGACSWVSIRRGQRRVCLVVCTPRVDFAGVDFAGARPRVHGCPATLNHSFWTAPTQALVLRWHVGVRRCNELPAPVWARRLGGHAFGGGRWAAPGPHMKRTVQLLRSLQFLPKVYDLGLDGS